MRADDSRSCFLPGSLQGVYQRRLYKELMKNYNPLERPVSNDSYSLTVHFSFSLLQIMDVAYHAHLLASNPAYRQQYEEQRQRHADKKAESKEREASVKEEWKQKASVLPTLSRAPSLTDLGARGGVNPAKSNEPAMASEQAKSVIMAKGEDSKAPAAQPEGLKIKLSEGGHHGKEEPKSGVESGRAASIEAAMWYRQEPDSRLWSYVYPSKYSEAPKPQEDDRWKEERDRKVMEERPRPKESLQKDETAKEAAEGRTQLPPEELRGGGKEARPPHMQFPSPLAQHQGYVPYMHGPYAYSQGYEPSHPGYRGMPSVMMQNYPGEKLTREALQVKSVCEAVQRGQNSGPAAAARQPVQKQVAVHPGQQDAT
ncbi:hypothetical protein ACER0C_023791 [Sarotherodon galilaeus]